MKMAGCTRETLDGWILMVSEVMPLHIPDTREKKKCSVDWMNVLMIFAKGGGAKLGVF